MLTIKQKFQKVYTNRIWRYGTFLAIIAIILFYVGISLQQYFQTETPCTEALRADLARYPYRIALGNVIMDADGSHAEPLKGNIVYNNSFNQNPSPNGQHVAFLRTDDYAPVTQTRPPQYVLVTDFSWSPSGDQIAFGTHGSDGYPDIGSAAAEIYTANFDGANVKRIYFFLQSANPDRGSFDSTHRPAWSPDGHYIAFFLEKYHAGKYLMIVQTDGSAACVVTPVDTYDHDPIWTPSQ
ncbi:MAG: hypothetical protein ABI947_00460 [Chloroflexota bacterium]